MRYTRKALTPQQVNEARKKCRQYNNKPVNGMVLTPIYFPDNMCSGGSHWGLQLRRVGYVQPEYEFVKRTNVSKENSICNKYLVPNCSI